MPELPEVERFRAFAQDNLVGRTIVRARALDRWMLREPGPRTFARLVSGRRVGSVARRGKVLIVFLAPAGPNEPVLLLHFGMTGELVTGEPDRWDRLVLELDDGTVVRLRDQRRLGHIRAVGRTDMLDLLWGLGPDALEAPLDWYADRLGAREAAVKAVMLDQSFLAGMGNVYADEALFAARIRPDRRASSLDRDELRRLHRSVGTVLRRAMRDGSPALRRGEDCPVCGARLRSERIGGRTSYFCRRCQR